MTFPLLPHPFDAAPTLVEGRGMARAWLTTPAGVVTQVADGAVMDRRIAEWLASDVTPALRAWANRTAPTSRNGVPSLRFVHDWRGVSRHDGEARRLLVDWGLSFARGEIERIDLITPTTMSAILSMAVATGRMALLAAGVKIDVVSDPARVLSGLDVAVTPR